MWRAHDPTFTIGIITTVLTAERLQLAKYIWSQLNPNDQVILQHYEYRGFMKNFTGRMCPDSFHTLLTTLPLEQQGFGLCDMMDYGMWVDNMAPLLATLEYVTTIPAPDDVKVITTAVLTDQMAELIERRENGEDGGSGNGNGDWLVLVLHAVPFNNRHHYNL